MAAETEILLKQIEKKRLEMIELGLTRTFVDESVVQLSGQLDKLLNQYEFLEKKQAGGSFS